MPAKTPPSTVIGKTTRINLAQLHTFHRNPRRGDIAAIAASLRAHGQYKPITANLGNHTGRPGEVLAGNHTLMAMRDLAADPDTGSDYSTILVHWVDVDDDMCNRIVLADNRTAELGGFDAEHLAALLESVGDELDGTGYTDAYVQMLSEIAAGPPDLDDLADEHGEPKETDAYDSLRLVLDPEVRRRWTAWRQQHDGNDTTALTVLLDAVEA